MSTTAVSSSDQTGLQQRKGFPETADNVHNEKGFNGAGNGNVYPPQGYPPNAGYQGQPERNGQPNYNGQQGYSQPASELPDNMYVDKHGNVKKKTRGGKLAACLVVCWACTWPCHGPCCGGL